VSDPGRIPTWQEGTEALLAKLPALAAQQAHLTINDARVIQYLAGLLSEGWAPVEGERNKWCRSPDHHDWQHMLLDRARSERDDAYVQMYRMGNALDAAGISLKDVNTPGPSIPVPNDDPACHCLLHPEAVPDGFTVVGFEVVSERLREEGDAVGGRIAYDPACPYHGAIVRSLSRSALGSLSIGFQ
jgi:hypothetical protein